MSGVVVLVFGGLLCFALFVPCPGDKEPVYEKKNPYQIGPRTAKDVEFNKPMLLQHYVFWSGADIYFPDYHLAFTNYSPNVSCTAFQDKVRCNVEKKRVFRWLPTEDVTPLVNCGEAEKCFVPFPIFKTAYRVIPFHEADRFLIDEYIISLPRPTFRALHGRGLPFIGPAERGIWYKVLYLYVHGFYNITDKRGSQIVPYNHTVALDLGNGLLDTIFGLTP
ncbi:hypothetical protein DSO57_1000134 [Entomophthora muscae]|uniref:Uncharacterized protein n=1 Tax=Entomophthora muscae TaxID=34485 RepID=A0ACC2SMD0_9FUNG|nr:hypothetical protein DSO57_1000134 [Entomophthora muscae]